jgi:hypothetical protein
MAVRIGVTALSPKDWCTVVPVSLRSNQRLNPSVVPDIWRAGDTLMAFANPHKENLPSEPNV